MSPTQDDHRNLPCVPVEDAADRDAVAELATVRDWLRHAVSRFNAAGLVYGHGTDTALDDAAFLILAALDLPIDQLEPWLDARLTLGERRRLDALIEARVTTRRPTAYVLGEAWMQGYRFAVDERVSVPRAHLGELLAQDAVLLAQNPEAIGCVLDLCTGSGCLAIIAAHQFMHAHVDAVDISTDALAAAERNIADHGLALRVTPIRSDLFAALDGRRYDMIVAHPPAATRAAVAAFPPEYRHEPRLAYEAGADGLDVVRRILEAARGHLSDHGTLVVEVGQARPALEALYPEIDFHWLDTPGHAGAVFMLPAEALPRANGPDGCTPSPRRRLHPA